MAAPLVDSTPAFVEEAYEKLGERLHILRQRVNRPMTYAEKVLLGHLDALESAELNAGESTDSAVADEGADHSGVSIGRSVRGQASAWRRCRSRAAAGRSRAGSKRARRRWPDPARSFR